jgi:hypothetical protein
VVADVICSDRSQIRSAFWRDAPDSEATVVPVADPAVPVVLDGELRAVGLAPKPAGLLPTLAQPATTRTIEAAPHGRHFRRTIAVTVFRTSSDSQ